ENDRPSELRIDGSATFTTVLSSMIMNSPTDTAASVHHCLFSAVTRRCLIRLPSGRSKLATANLARPTARGGRVGYARVNASEIVWRPDDATVERANVTRLLRRAGVADYAELVRRSWEEPEWFWPLVVDDLGLELAQRWERILDTSRGVEWASWFVGARLSIAENCVHRWARRTPEAVAAVGLAEDGSRSELTFAQLSRKVTQLAEELAALGVLPGDRVAIFLPMSPDVAIASHAVAHLGAIQVPVFSGFAAPAVAERLRASEAKVVITQRSSARRGRAVPMLEILEQALEHAPSVEHVVLAPFALDERPGDLPALDVDSETPYLLTYTSGTTGAPKGVVHVQGGFLVS